MSTALDRRTQALLDARTSQLARRGTERSREEATSPFLVCAVGGELCGLPLGQVAAVLPDRPSTALPGAPAALRGVVALSGGIVSVIDLGIALGLPATPPQESGLHGHLVRLRAQNPPIALGVTRVLGIAHIAASAIGAGVDGRLGAEAVSGYAPPGSDASGVIADGFSVIDLRSLLDRFRP